MSRLSRNAERRMEQRGDHTVGSRSVGSTNLGSSFSLSRGQRRIHVQWHLDKHAKLDFRFQCRTDRLA